MREQVLITGWVDRPELYIKCFDVGVLTSKWEGFGLVLAEYMACCVPSVASDVSGISYVVTDEYSGLLCESGNVEQFVEKILRLLHNKSLSDGIVSNAYKEVHERFSIEKMAAQYDVLYREIAKRN